MKIEFEERFDVPVERAYEYFRVPTNWPRLFPAFAEVRDLGDGWHAVPFKGFPFPLVTRITRDEPLRCVEWEFEGFWRGDARVTFEPVDGGVVIRGYEEVSPHRLSVLAPVVERLFLEQRFRRVWESGWSRLRRQATASGDHVASPAD
jgi:hypothetical protein